MTPSASGQRDTRREGGGREGGREGKRGMNLYPGVFSGHASVRK